MTRRISQRSVAGVLVLLAGTPGCDGGSGPPSPALVEATSGAGQTAPVRSLLPEPLGAPVVDAGGTPVPGVRVNWAAAGDGKVEPAASTTDVEGRARARWVLGGTAGPSQASASVPQLAPATFTATAELPDEFPLDEIRLLELPTYEGSGQVVHPDYVHSPAGVFGSAHHLAITPYPFGDAKWENPSHFIGGGFDEWELEAGAPNPVVRPAAGYHSDPDMVFVPETAELWLYYRQVTGDNFVLLTRSRDGLTWGPPVEVVRRPPHEVVSQTVVRRGPGDWYMWAVNAGETGCAAPSTVVELRRSADGIHWSPAAPVDLRQDLLYAWHIDVEWIPSRNEFWALYNVKTNGGCATPALFLATSPDGVHWNVLGPVLKKGRIPAFADIVYRASLNYDPETDRITFWYSGARYGGDGKYVWSAAVERRRRADVFDVSAMTLGPTVFAPPPAELTDWP
jgi:hypothetical protein